MSERLTTYSAWPDELVVNDKYLAEPIGVVKQDSVAEATQKIELSLLAAQVAAGLTRHKRAQILNGAAARLEDRAESAARLIVAEAGKTIRQARADVSRAVNTLRLSANEALRNAGEVIPFDSFPGGAGRRGWFSREPLGLIAAITPYNDALNLVAHKLGPALAGGNAIVLKPSQYTPLTALLLVDLLVEAGLPQGVITVLHGNRQVGQTLVESPAVRMVSFTGGFETGKAISSVAGIKRLSMELGGNAPNLVFSDANLDKAIDACVSGAFWAAGQNCIGVQRILIQREVFDDFLEGFLAVSTQLVTGDPREESTDVGPMISVDAAETARQKVEEAVNSGAHLLTGGVRSGSLLTPAVLTDVPRNCSIWAEEVFAPIVALEAFDDEGEAIYAANDCEYALQAGVFTNDIGRALRVAVAIEAGGVMINDSSDYRLDAMPFGGAKYGSMGREGVRFAYEEMTQTKVVMITT